jgi:hypothetical protein
MNNILYTLCVEISGSKIHYLKCKKRTTINAIIVIKEDVEQRMNIMPTRLTTGMWLIYL